MVGRSTKPVVGQTWLPTKPGSGWRYVCEVNLSTVRFRRQSGDVRLLWLWEWDAWCRRFDCILAPSATSTLVR
jgi:hypothetical protein